jgi:hypothetical protein
MITADRHARKPSSGALPVHKVALPVIPPANGPSTVPSTLARPPAAVISDVLCTAVVLALGASAGFPLMWGLALHQTPMAVSAGCTELLCLVVLLNRCFAPVSTRTHVVPFLTALEERPVVLAFCLGLALTSGVILLTCWPG